MVVVQTLRLLKTVRQKCSHPAVVGVEQESGEISTGPRQQKEQENSEPRHLKLQFSNNMINGPIYTGRPIGEDLENTLNLDLVDCRTGNIVTYGAEASAKVEIFAVEKDEFKIATSLADGKSLIRRDPHVSLKYGRVSVSHISFKHTRVNMRNRELRLAARVVYPRNIGARIVEAVTEPFFVKDRRAIGKSRKPLFLDDQVWKLQNIAEEGAFHNRLKKEKILTVRDFLTNYFLNRENLLKILGRRMPGEKLDAAVNQAKGKLDLKRYVYLHKNSRVVFTDVGELIGVNQEGQFVPVEQLTQTQKDDARNLVICAFRHWEEVVSFEDESSLMDWVMQISTVQFSSNSPMVGNNVLASQKVNRSEYQQLSASTPDIMPSFCSIDGFSSLDDYVLHGIDNMDVRFDQPLNFPGQDNNSLMADTDSITRPSFCDDDHLPFFDDDYSLPSPNFAPSPDLQCAVNSFLAHSSTIVPLDKAQRRWKMLFSVLRWFSVRRIVNRRTITS